MTIDQDVQKLLQPTDDVSGWYGAVRALDAAKATPLVVQVLQDENESDARRRLAATMLGVLGDPRAIAALVSVLHTRDSVLRGRAAETLGSFPGLDPAIVNQLMQGLEDNDRYFRECCAKALGMLRWTAALPQLQHMRDHDSAISNREAAQAAIHAIQGGR